MNKLDEFKKTFEDLDIQRYTVKWLVYWIGVMAFYIFVLKPLGLNYADTFKIMSSYFVVAGCGGLYFFFPREARNYFKDTKTQLALILLSMLLFFFVTISLSGVVPISQEMTNTLLEYNFYYPLFKVGTTASKLADIFFQQTLILSIVLFLKQNCSSKRVAVAIFTFIFFVLHIPLLVVFGWLGFAFIIPSLFAGAIFSTFILNSRFGLFYSFAIHELFYLALGIIFRLY